MPQPLVQIAQAPTKRRIVALVGPPNSGKSTLFNRLTGLRQKVANYPGVTVEQRWGQLQLRRGQHKVPIPVDLVDLPGIYSLDPRSEDEQVTRDVLAGNMPGASTRKISSVLRPTPRSVTFAYFTTPSGLIIKIPRFAKPFSSLSTS